MGRGSKKPEENGSGETKDKKLKRRGYHETGRAGRRTNGDDPNAKPGRPPSPPPEEDDNGDERRDQ